MIMILSGFLFMLVFQEWKFLGHNVAVPANLSVLANLNRHVLSAHWQDLS